MKTSLKFRAATMAIVFTSPLLIAAGSHSDGINAQYDKGGNIKPSFDIVHAKVTAKNNIVTFNMAVAAQAGSNKPSATGQLAGSNVFSYVWPTSLNSSIVGFEENAGILALAVTAHPDFDDTPLYDENADSDPNNDGNIWHSHWVVLQPNEQCGKGALGVVDIPEGSSPKLPTTWPGLPILLDSPGWDPIFNGDSIEVKVAFNNTVDINNATYDAVTAGLRVNKSVHVPLLCVVDVMDIASGDLSLPGKVNK
tara:strand:+ start:44 stop:799 length:756 start_codon:yes stop_codon:yes gene_type:complete